VARDIWEEAVCSQTGKKTLFPELRTSASLAQRNIEKLGILSGESLVLINIRPIDRIPKRDILMSNLAKITDFFFFYYTPFIHLRAIVIVKDAILKLIITKKWIFTMESLYD
jgi:hypothetical protein